MQMHTLSATPLCRERRCGCSCARWRGACGRTVPAPARLGAMAFIHRFGSALNPHLHFHCVVLDGVSASTPTGGVRRP